jgi:hypothetical protein
VGAGTALRVRAAGCCIELATADPTAERWLRANFGALPPCSSTQAADLCYEVLAAHAGAHSTETPTGYLLKAPGQPAKACTGGSELLFELEQHLVVALQQAHPGLLFLHAASLTYRGRVCLLVGESGAGKSTTAWALLNRGWGYLSDELAPLDPLTWQVQPYAHALCMKQKPPGGGPWPPPGLLDLGATLHVPVAAPPPGPGPLGAIVFVQHLSGSTGDGPADALPAPAIRPVSAAEATARLYVQALNVLAHPARGLDVVRQAALQVPCFQLCTAGLQASAELLEQTLDGLPQAATARGSPAGSPGPLQTAASQNPAPSSA